MFYNQLKTVASVTFTSTALLLGTASMSAQADTVLGIYADATMWMYGSDAKFQQANTSKESFDFGNNNAFNVSAALEHGVPVIPNVRVRHGSIDVSKEKNVTNFQVNGQTYSGSTTASLDMTHTDIFAYYEILDNLVSVDVGLGAKVIDGDATVKSNVQNSTQNSTESLSVTVPMLYASVGGNLPFTGLSAKADLAGLSYKDNRIVDAQAEVKYNFIDKPLFDFGAKVGYRMLDVKIDDVLKTDVSATFKGPYIGLEAHF